MNIQEAIIERHSVRKYIDKAIPKEIVAELTAEIKAANKKSGLNIQLVTGEPKAFDGIMAHYGKFSGVQTYIALIGGKNDKGDELVG